MGKNLSHSPDFYPASHALAIPASIATGLLRRIYRLAIPATHGIHAVIAIRAGFSLVTPR